MTLDPPAKQKERALRRPRIDGNRARLAHVTAELFEWDEELPGFGLRHYPSGRKRWIVQFRLRGAPRRATLGDPAVMGGPEAREKARAILAEVAVDGLPVPRSEKARRDPTFADYVEEFWRDCAHHWKPSTQARNRRAINRKLCPIFGRSHLGSISKADVLSWRGTMVERQGTFNRTLPVLAAMLTYAEKLGYRTRGSNPCRGTPRYRRQLPDRYLAPHEYRRLGRVLASDAESHPEEVAAIRLLIFTGARLGEITGLRWEWIEPQVIHLLDSKTGAKRIWLNAQARGVLSGMGTRVEGYVFAQLSSRACQLPNRWARLRRAAALPDVRLHDLRHSFASAGVAAGASFMHIGRLLGHALPETTARYVHLADQSIIEAARRVSGSLAASMGLRR